MIEAFRLGIHARGATLWDGVDLAFGDGSVHVVVGPPACGKTTLLSVLRGERQPDAGDVVVSGESLYRDRRASYRAYRAASGHVPERFADPAGQTVSDLFRLSSVAGGGIPAGERGERQERLLSMVGLSDAGDWRLSSLSASERVRAALAAELLRSPRFLFGDGVVAAAGTPYREMLGGLFRALAREGITIVLAERLLPERWSAAGEGAAAGPFHIYKVPVPATGTGDGSQALPAGGGIA